MVCFNLLIIFTLLLKISISNSIGLDVKFVGQAQGSSFEENSTFQQRLQQQRQQQQQQQQQHRMNQQEQLKQLQTQALLKQASTASIGVLFGALIWRSLAAIESLSLIKHNNIMKSLIKIPTFLLLTCNIIGFLIGIMRAEQFKNQLKGILAMNLIREFLELIINLFYIIVPRILLSSKIPR